MEVPTTTFTTIELRMPRNMVRYFNALAQTIENEGSFDAYKDRTTREVIFNAPLFLECNQEMLDDLISIYQAHYGFHLANTELTYDGLWTDIDYKIITVYPAPLDIIIKLVNFLDYYDAPLLLRGFTRRIRSTLCSMKTKLATPKPVFEPQSLIEKVFAKEVGYRNQIVSFLKERVSNLDLFDRLTHRLWSKLGPFVVCKKDFTIVATTEGLFGFGNNKNGVLGLGDTQFVETPTRIPLEHVSSFACNEYYSVFLTRDGLYECGLPLMRYREPSKETPTRKPTKILVDIGPIHSFACGNRHMLVLGQNGNLYGYGFNSWGQLGLSAENGDPILDFESGEIGVYMLFVGLKDIVSFACGDNHTLILTKEGLFGCGSNRYGELGFGEVGEIHKLTQIPIEGVISFWCGPSQTMILTENGLFACGENENGQLGVRVKYDNGDDMDYVKTLTRVPLEGVISVSFDGNTTLILTKDGLYACGYNAIIIFYPGAADIIYKPIRVPIEKVVSMACGESHYAVVTLDGLYVYGKNEKGALGLGHKDDVYEPTKLTSLRIGIEESSQLTRDLPSEIKIENEPEAKKRRTDSLLCTRCDNIATHVEPFQERFRFCSTACYRDFFTPKERLTQ